MSTALAITGSARYTNTHAAPALLASVGPPTRAVLASADDAAEVPWPVLPAPPDPIDTSPNWPQAPLLRVYTHVAPAPGAPTMTVLPSPETDTDAPWRRPADPSPTSLAPCWVHTPPLRVYTHTAPADALSSGPPTTAVFPSADSATDCPWCPAPTAPVPTSFAPCCVHVVPLYVYTHAAPLPALSSGPPTMAVLPSAESATELPCLAPPAAAPPTSFAPCCSQLPRRTNTQTAPAPLLSSGPPTMAVLPSPESATELPCCSMPTGLPTSFACWDHVSPLNANTHVAPRLPLSALPPTMAVFPSADIATETPCFAAPIAPVPTSFVPCWLHAPEVRVNIHAAPALLLSRLAPTMAAFPSPEIATADPCPAPIP